MKSLMTCCQILVWGTGMILAQQNDMLRGEILFLSSGKQAAIGVEVSGSIRNAEYANPVYTTSTGEFQLHFPNARDGYRVTLTIGTTDKNGTEIELVNDREVEECRIPANPLAVFPIIVCRKGARDKIAQKYYRIIKTSADIALEKTKKSLDSLRHVRNINYQLIGELSARIQRLELQNDSLSIYREAFRIASINKDNASDRVLKYIRLLDEGKSVQEAREALSIKKAAKDLKKNLSEFEDAIKELEHRARASLRIEEVDEALRAYQNSILYFEKMGKDSLSIVDIYWSYAQELYHAGQYGHALSFHRKAYDIQTIFLRPDHLDFATSYYHLAGAWYGMGQYDSALAYAQASLQIRRDSLSDTDLALALAFDRLGLCQLALGHFNQANKQFAQALQILKSSTDFSYLSSLANTYSHLGVVYHELGAYQQALQAHQSAIYLWKNLHDRPSVDLATSYTHLSRTHLALGSIEQAFSYQQQSLNIRTKFLSDSHPLLAESYQTLALIWKRKGQLDSTLHYQDRARKILQHTLPSTHPTLATLFHNIALSHQALNNYDRAIHYHEQAIRILTKGGYVMHPDLATSYHGLAVTFARTGQFEQALEVAQKSLNIREQIYPNSHPAIAHISQTCAAIYLNLQQYELAIQYQKQSISAYEKSELAAYPGLSTAYAQLSQMFRWSAQVSQALFWQKKALYILESSPNRSDKEIGVQYLHLAAILLSEHKPQEADKAFQQGIIELEAELSINQPLQKKVAELGFMIQDARAKKAFADQDYTSALRTFSQYPSAKHSGKSWTYIGLCHYYLEQYPDAIHAYQQAAILSPAIKAHHFYNNLGLAYIRQGKFDRAQAAFEQYEHLAPLDGRAYRNWAIFHALQHEYDRALEYLAQAVDLGYNKSEWMESEVAFIPIHSDKSYLKLLNKARKAQKK
ncbi:MAG: tetratricopeptide repeat protein [Bacteroidota bacterium]